MKDNECSHGNHDRQIQVCERMARISPYAAYLDPSQTGVQDIMPISKPASVALKGPREFHFSRKRPAEEDGADRAERNNKKHKLAHPGGLVNFRNACFSNSSLQILSEALTPAQIAQLASIDALENFGYDVHARTRLSGKKFKVYLDKLHQGIVKGAQSKSFELAPYMGKVLEELRSGQGAPANPELFQHVFAYGGVEDDRENLSGETQQDPSEYLRKLVLAVSTEQPFVSDIFQHRVSETIVCTTPKCGYRNEMKTHAEILMELPIAAEMTRTSSRGQARKLQSTTLDDALERYFAKSRLEGSTCEKCKSKDTLVEQTSMTKAPDYLLIAVNRAVVDGRGRLAKNDTKLILNLGDIRLGEENVFRMTGLVKHDGSSMQSGHYIAYRQVEAGRWAVIDDETVKSVPERNLDDGVKGHSSLLLLQRQSGSSRTPPPEQVLEG